MLLIVAIVLFVIWLLARLAFKITSGFIHIILAIAVIVLLVHMLRR